MNLTQMVKEQALRLGFSLVGVTSPDPLPHAHVFESWLDQGRQGEMAYLDTPHSRAFRVHPLQVLPECRSVLVLGIRYPAPIIPVDHPGSILHGRVASYAWGEDYHLFLPRRMEMLVEYIDAEVRHPLPNRRYTDTGPILERELAQRAGLGWIGKNTCLIDPSGGSYFLLAEVLLGLELEPDAPFLFDRCGTCQRCLRACPTGCILPDRTLDARRCISYLTIELKGAVPVELRSQMGRWVFGCDVCQQVCPWNRFAGAAKDDAFVDTQAKPGPNLIEELSLSPEEFNRKFRRSPIKRAKRRGYLRNIAIALGNLKDELAVPALAQALSSEAEPLVRSHAAWALGRIGDRPARQALEKALSFEPDMGVKSEIQAALQDH